MKPTPQFNDNYRRDWIEAGKGAAFPKTDFNFKASSFGDSSDRCGGHGFPSFRGISEDYFKNDVPNHFRSEAAFFGLIVITVAVPVFQAVRGLVVLFYGSL